MSDSPTKDLGLRPRRAIPATLYHLIFRLLRFLAFPARSHGLSPRLLTFPARHNDPIFPSHP